jgi:hypothetical protein
MRPTSCHHCYELDISFTPIFPFPAGADRARIEAAAPGVAVFRLDPDS